MNNPIFQKAGDLFFPPKCVCCGEIITGKLSRTFCDKCFVLFVDERESKCTVCSKSYIDCFCKPEHLQGFDFIFGLPYDATLPVCRSLILSVKREKNTESTLTLAKSMLKKANKLGGLPKNSVVTYIPRNRVKYVKYATDQGKELAKCAAKLLNLRFAGIFEHKVLGAEQKRLSAETRLTNAQRSFCIKKRQKKTIDGKTVVIIDDVATTGSTLAVCAEIAKENGASDVVCMSAAKRDRHDEPFT